jgi:hypothetical protein
MSQQGVLKHCYTATCLQSNAQQITDVAVQWQAVMPTPCASVYVYYVYNPPTDHIPEDYNIFVIAVRISNLTML